MITLAAISAIGLSASRSGVGRVPDMILFNGKIVTVDQHFSIAQALAIAEGKILAVSSNEEIVKQAGSSTRKFDLRGKTVVPGLADNHLHSAGGGPGVDLSRVRTMAELLEAIAEQVKRARPGELIMTNADWHEGQLKEQRLPLRWDLDQVAPNNPVVVARGMHEFILNSAALKKWNISRDTPVPSGGRISRYEDGELNGELVGAAKKLVDLPEPPPKDLETRIQDQLDEYRKLHAVGLTSIRHPGGPIEQYRLLQEMKHRGLLTMRVNFVVGTGGAKEVEEITSLVSSWNVQPDEGDHWLRIGGVKIFLDGGFEGGWLREPYAEPWGKGGTYYGLPLLPRHNYVAMVKELGRRNWRVATHAVGDAALDLVLDAYEQASQEKSIVGRRWTIEHGFLPQADHYARINRLGVLVAAQNHLYVAGPSLQKYWGRKRAEWVTPMRAYLDNQVMVSAGTDSPVIPYNPLWVIYHFVTRDTISGGVFGEDQRISREEALRAITINNAYLSFEENVKGSLEPGKVADLVVLSGDIMTCPKEEIPHLSVLLTMVNGQIVFKNEDFK